MNANDTTINNLPKRGRVNASRPADCQATKTGRKNSMALVNLTAVNNPTSKAIVAGRQLPAEGRNPNQITVINSKFMNASGRA